MNKPKAPKDMTAPELVAYISTAEIVNGLKNTYDIFAANFARGSGKGGMRMEIVQSIAFAIVRLERLETENAALRAQEQNEPLTWKELVSAETTPVYIRNLEYKEESMWAVVGNEYDKIGFTFVNLYDETESDCGCKELYGQTWIAYRYEPKGARQ